MTKAEEAANKRYPIHPFSVTPQEGEHGEILNFDEWLEDFRIGIQSFSANGGFQQGYEQATKDLGWISVKDRLPEKDHFVITCVDDYGHPQSVGMAMLLEDGTWWDGDMKVYVDCWMEVPKFNNNEK